MFGGAVVPERGPFTVLSSRSQLLPAGFRCGPYDVAVKITNEHGQVLCSNDRTRQVALLSPQEAEETDHNGCYVWNNAWECTPDLDSNDADEFLDKYMDYAEFK